VGGAALFVQYRNREVLLFVTQMLSSLLADMRTSNLDGRSENYRGEAAAKARDPSPQCQPAANRQANPKAPIDILQLLAPRRPPKQPLPSEVNDRAMAAARTNGTPTCPQRSEPGGLPPMVNTVVAASVMLMLRPTATNPRIRSSE